jgi:hypothetical protein
MKTKTARGIAACGTLLTVIALACLTLTWFASASVAQTAAKSLRDQLVGNWQLVSVSLGHTDPYGEKPQGNMSFDAGGHFSVIVLSGGQAKNISYFGTYKVDDASNSMTIHIDGSSLAHQAGRDLKRTLAFNGDELIVESGNGNVKLTWKRSS